MMRRLIGPLCAALLAITALMGASQDAEAFCGFYVSGADTKLYNNATMVVMMREGTKTILSMQNNYEGPPKDFAMVVPVPVVLQKENVKTLNNKIFDKVDRLASPRLVEYWEQDPCNPSTAYGFGGLGVSGVGRGGGGVSFGSMGKGAVKVEAQFEVEEYEIVILSATESNALETWLKDNKYNIPDGAAASMAPYIQQGMYFFVAKVNAKKVKYESLNGVLQATLSPLRFHYDSDNFSLPVRLGLLNAKGKQDLIVHILAKNQRYEVANLPNVTIPTNLIVKDDVRRRFAEFYATLFDRVTEENPGAVVTEYAWDASTCDPCPGPALDYHDLQKLGADVLLASEDTLGLGIGRSGFRGSPNSWTITRLHARYSAGDLKDDLVFKKAEAIIGGRGMPHGVDALLSAGVIGEQRAVPGMVNNFQGRYIMLNAWTGDIKCAAPKRGVWGGPVNGPTPKPVAAQKTAFAPRGELALAEVVTTKEIPGLGRPAGQAIAQLQRDPDSAKAPSLPSATEPAKPEPTKDSSQGDGQPKPAEVADKTEQPSAIGCASAPTPSAPPLWVLLFAGVGAALRRSRAKRR